MTLTSTVNRDPAEFEGRSFWTYTLFAKSALIHIKYNVRDEQWESDLEALKNYLRYYAPRYKFHGMCAWKLCGDENWLISHIENYLREIEALE